MNATPVKRTVTIVLCDVEESDEVQINVTFDPPVATEDHDQLHGGASYLAVKVLNCIQKELA